MIQYSNTDNCRFILPRRRTISQWIKTCIAGENHKTGDIAIVFCDADYHRNVNIEYLGHDYDTDVITFDYTEGDVISGDILIGVDTVIDNAKMLDVEPLTEIERIIIHGVLHLCGYKDKAATDKARMSEREEYWLCVLSGML